MTTVLAKYRLNSNSQGELPPSAVASDIHGGIFATGPTIQMEDDALLIYSGRPTFADSGDRETIGKSILAAYVERGPGFLSDIHGPFSLCIFLRNQKKALIAIDRMGIERLTWTVANGDLTAGSSAIEVVNCSERARTLNQQSLFNFMLGHMIPSPDTVFTDVQKLEPATAIEFNDAQPRVIRYWQPGFDRQGDANLQDLRSETLPTLRRAVKRLRPDETTGSFLSGGLDSSTITGILADLSGSRGQAFSVGFGVEEFDELKFARIAGKHFSCPHHEYVVTADDVVELIPLAATAFDEPFGNSSAVPTYACAQLAKRHGATHLLAGDGGDELFGGNERYTRHRTFERFSRVPTFFREAIFSPFAHALDPERSIWPLRKFSSFVRQAEIPLPDRFESWNLIYREGPAKIFDKDFLATIDTEQPLRLMRDAWDSCPSDDLLNKMLWYDWKFTLADNDLRKVKTMCELADVQVSFPMLDEEFVDLSIALPSAEKIRGGELRHFFRDVVSTYLPPEILSKQKHGFGLPFGQWLKVSPDLQTLVYDSVENLSKRSIFRRDFLHNVVTEHRTGHASYFGYAIWDLIMLEQWLAANS